MFVNLSDESRGIKWESLTFGGSYSVSFGCMSAALTNVMLSYDSQRTKAFKGENRLSNQEAYAEFCNLKNYACPKEDRERFFKGLADLYGNYSFVMMADNINYQNDGAYGDLNTRKFVEWIAENKYGVLVTGPLSRNPNYNGLSSLTQGWIWVHPAAMKHMIPHSEQVLYPEGVDWEGIKGDLAKVGAKSSFRLAMETFLPRTVLTKRAWKSIDCEKA